MKSLNLFTRLFTIVVLLTMGSLALAAYSAKKAYDTDPELLSKIEKKFNIHIRTGGFYISNGSDRNSSQDSWQMPVTQKTIRIKTFSGRIAIKTTSSGEIAISASGELDKSKSPKLLEVNSSDQELTISEPENAVSDLEVHIEIPNSFKQELFIESISGDVSIENLSPNILTVATVSGDLVFDSIKADNLNLNSISGNSHVRSSSISTINGKTVSGEIQIDNKGSATTRLKSISGDIDLKLPLSESFRFDLTTISGEIKNAHADKNKAVATIEITTTSGDIAIE